MLWDNMLFNMQDVKNEKREGQKLVPEEYPEKQVLLMRLDLTQTKVGLDISTS